MMKIAKVKRSLRLSRETVRSLDTGRGPTLAKTTDTGQETGGSDSCNNCPTPRRP